MKNRTISFSNIQELETLLTDINDIQVLIQIFCVNNDLEEIRTIQQYFYTNFPLAHIIGTTTDGVIDNSNVYVENKHVVTITKFEHTHLETALIAHDDSLDMNFVTGQKLAQRLFGPKTKTMICFTDGLHTNAEDFLAGISSINKDIIVAGGMAGDNGKLEKTYVFDKHTICDKGAVAVCLNSDVLHVYSDYSFDWHPIGKRLQVTKAVKNRVYEIEGMSTVDIYAKYMGEELANNLPNVGIEFPMIFQKDGMEIGRVPLAKHNDGSLTFSGNIETGTYVKFGIGNLAAIFRDSDSHINEIFDNITYQPEAVFIYSCMARRRFMNNYMQAELQALSALGNLSGFFTYGEFLHHKEENILLNESMTLLALSEEKSKIKDLQRINNIDKMVMSIRPEHVLAHLANTVSSELAELNDQLEEKIQKSAELIYKQAFYDKLTNLPNRTTLLNILDDFVGKTVFLTNIDDFTTINDFYGHVAGDMILQQMAKLLQRFALSHDVEVYRLPSDEFAMVSLVEQSPIEIENFIKRLLADVEKEQFHVNDFIVHVSVTVSASYLNSNNTGLANADMALKTAKRLHKQYLIFDQDLELSKEYESNLTMANEIKRAIENDDIIPYFQPVYEIGTQKIEKYEALVRLRKSNGEILSPYFFLDISEKIKLYPRITEIMIEKSFAFFAKNGHKFSINLAFSDILNEKTRAYLFEKIDEYKIASQLTIEILETQEYSNEAIINEFTQDVYKHGAMIAIDDFGSGFANFQHMTDIYCDYMKIDGSLIKNIHKNKNDRLIVETIVVFAKKLHKKIIAEFVHCKEVYDVVKELGIDYAQGYYLGEPKETVI